jgi:hypothetical protein
MTSRWIVLLLLLAACGGEKPPAVVSDTVASAPPTPAPEMVLSAPHGVEVWFTDARAAKDSAGGSCTERVMQVRRDGKEIAVPLLYTGARPTIVNDSTIEAAIWLNCKPGNVYHVNLRTGYPNRVK